MIEKAVAQGLALYFRSTGQCYGSRPAIGLGC